MNVSLTAISALGILGVGAGMAIALYASLGPKGVVVVAWNNYVAKIDKKLRFLFSDVPPKRVALLHMAFLGFCVFMCALAGNLVILIAVVPFIFAPMLYLDHLCGKRVEQLEQQIDGWLLVLANSLRATPSLGDALEASSTLVNSPLSDELALMVKENQLGVPIDHALNAMAERIGSRAFSGAIVTLLIARNSGGNLSKTLETSAAALREMARLEANLRAKTAEAKSQAYVLAAIPAVMIGLIHAVDPELMRPLITNFVGNILAAIALCLWAGSVFVARKILAVEL